MVVVTKGGCRGWKLAGERVMSNRKAIVVLSLTSCLIYYCCIKYTERHRPGGIDLDARSPIFRASNEIRHPSRVRDGHRRLRLRESISDALDPSADPHRRVLGLPPVLHGKQRFMDTAGRIERFRQKFATAGRLRFAGASRPFSGRARSR